MFRDASFSPSYTSPQRSPSPTPSHQNNANNLDDIFGSAPPSPTQQGNTEPSDIPRLRSSHSTAGYRDGLTASKATTIQEGFDEGYSLGATMGLRVGQIIGMLEGIWSAVLKSEKAGQTAENEASAGVVAGQEEQSEAKRLQDLVTKARHELRTEGVFSKDYWAPNGIWVYEAEEGDGGWSDIVDAHPLVRQWERTVAAEVAKVNLDTGVLERQEVKRLGEEETS